MVFLLPLSAAGDSQNILQTGIYLFIPADFFVPSAVRGLLI
jgi:hypothetical protein